TNNYSTGALTAVGTVSFSTTYAVVSSLTESFTTGQTNYYFLVLTDNYSTGASTTVAFNFTSGQTKKQFTLSSGNSNTATVTGSTYTILGSPQTYIWVGHTNDWNLASNWSPAVVPASIDNADI